MSEERMRILEMVRDGKVTADEGARLLEALQPKAQPRPGSDSDDPLRNIAGAVAQAIQSGDWRGLAGQWASSWSGPGGGESGGDLPGAARRAQREQDGWEMLTFSEGDHGTFDLPDGARLTVESEAGSIDAAAGDGPARLDLEGEGAHNFAVYVARKEAEVVVAAYRTAPFSRLPRLVVAVPRTVAHVALRTAGGSLKAERFACPVSLKTAGGSIAVRKHGPGAVEARTAGGSIAVDGTPDSIDLHTSGGSIKFEGRTKATTVKTSGGSIHLDGVRLTSGEHHVKTSGGGIRVELDRESSVELTAKTSAGSINVDLPGADGERSGSRVSPKYHGRYNGGEAQLHLGTAAGGITVGLSARASRDDTAGEAAA